MTGNYVLVYNLAEKLRFIGILAYPKIYVISYMNVLKYHKGGQMDERT
jgi:hypothetical protein